jgi:hypothetical protein
MLQKTFTHDDKEIFFFQHKLNITISIGFIDLYTFTVQTTCIMVPMPINDAFVKL